MEMVEEVRMRSGVRTSMVEMVRRARPRDWMRREDERRTMFVDIG